ncbi:hypothetical protein BOX15_Mlig001215g3 [Macrostomum lignano]|uniref:ANK_REP_REGION domain-containing protein n=1 Tax=Macrostomum lignano TaxID=282301 RepID=A0A267FMJ4_9PLAT|nr:hypothetical protein BOX15_Mlig001215g3 [Macrostomum lignano]
MSSSAAGTAKLFSKSLKRHRHAVPPDIERYLNFYDEKNGLNALHLASKEGHTAVVQELLSRGADPDARTKKGNSALHIASLAGQLEVVKLLIERGAKVNCQSQAGFSPLYMAAQENHLEVVRHLIASGASQSLATTDGFTPLAVALQQGHDKVVAVLLETDTRCRSRMPALHVAAKKDDVRSAGLLLTSDCDPNHQAGSGFTALHIAAHYGSAGVASLLLDRGADPNFPARNGIAPLHVAAKWGMLSVAQKLIERGAAVDARTRDGLTAVHCAARSGQTAVLKLLLELNAGIDLRSRSGLSPLHMAVQGDHTDCARLLLARGANSEDVTVDQLTPLHVAAHCGYVSSTQLLLDSGCRASARALNGFTALHIACKKGRVRIVELLLNYGAEPDAATDVTGLTPLHVAAFLGQTACAALLVDRGRGNASAVTAKGETPLHMAMRGGHTETARLLLEQTKVNADAAATDGQTSLHVACRTGNAEAVELLLKAGANPDAACRDGYTGLHFAAREGHDAVIRILLNSQQQEWPAARLQPVTRKGATPLHLAARSDQAVVTRQLVEAGADLNCVGGRGVTPLHLAANGNRLQALQALLSAGANPNCFSSSSSTATTSVSGNSDIGVEGGWTPLHAAARRGHADAVASLLKAGAKPQCTGGSSGQTPLHLAAREGHIEVVRLLLDQPGVTADCRNAQNLTPAHLANQTNQVEIFELLKPLTTSSAWQAEVKDDADRAPESAISEDLATVISESDDETAHMTEATFTQLPASPIFSRPDSGVVADGQAKDQQQQQQKQNQLQVPGASRTNVNQAAVPEPECQKQSAATAAASVPVPNIQQLEPKLLLLQQQQETPSDQMPVLTSFLVSFIVDARGGAMTGARCPGLRVVVPPKAAGEPLRLTCRLLRPDRLTSPPQLCDGEGLASRILELGGGGVDGTFRSPIVLEVPHIAALRNGEREVVVYRSETGDVWKEHPTEAGGQDSAAVLDALSGLPGPLETSEELREKRIIRILTTSMPQYFALVTRPRQETALIGPEGGAITSTGVSRQVQAIFPDGALTKKIRVAIQVMPIPLETAAQLAQVVSASPIVTIEPRRRKFHKPITLTIPVPPRPSGQTDNWTLRLMCSITGGAQVAAWEDITGSTPLSRVKECVSFTTTVSARFWLLDCPNGTDAVSLATRIYRDCLPVPYIGRFVVYAKRNRPDGAMLRCLCVTDDKLDKTLECAEGYERKAESAEFEVLDGRKRWVTDAPGNLTVIADHEATLEKQQQSEQQQRQSLTMTVRPFRENRLSCQVRVSQPDRPAVGRLVLEPASGSACSVELALPEYDGPPMPTPPQSDRQQPQRLSDPSSRETTPEPLRLTSDTIARAELDIRDVAEKLRSDWSLAAQELGLTDSDIAEIAANRPDDRERAMSMLRRWRRIKEPSGEATGNALEAALRRIGRDDVVKQCMRNVQYVTEPKEHEQARALLDGKDDSKTAVEVHEADVVPQLDETRPKPKSAPTAEEAEAARRVKIDAYVGLLESLDQMLPDPESLINSHDRDWKDAEPIEEEAISAKARKQVESGEASSPTQVEELLSKLDSLPDQSMAPEAEPPEDVVEVPKSVAVSHTALPAAVPKSDGTPPAAAR